MPFNRTETRTENLTDLYYFCSLNIGDANNRGISFVLR